MGFFWDMGFRTWTDRQTDIVLTVPKTCEVNEKKSKRQTDTHTMFVIIYKIRWFSLHLNKTPLFQGNHMKPTSYANME
jgi:hypothetical protein